MPKGSCPNPRPDSVIPLPYLKYSDSLLLPHMLHADKLDLNLLLEVPLSLFSLLGILCSSLGDRQHFNLIFPGISTCLLLCRIATTNSPPGKLLNPCSSNTHTLGHLASLVPAPFMLVLPFLCPHGLSMQLGLEKKNIAYFPPPPINQRPLHECRNVFDSSLYFLD